MGGRTRDPRRNGGRRPGSPGSSVLGVVYEMAWNRMAGEAWHVYNDIQRAGGKPPTPERAAANMAVWAKDPTNPAPLVEALVEAMAWAYSNDRTLRTAPRLVARINTDKE